MVSLRGRLLSGDTSEVNKLVLEHRLRERLETERLARDSGRAQVGVGPQVLRHVTAVGHVSLPRVEGGVGRGQGDGLVEQDTTQAHLLSLAKAVSGGQALLLKGGVGVGKSCLVRELGERVGQQLHPEFRLFLTQRGETVCGELSKLALSLSMAPLAREEMRQLLGQSFPSLGPALTEKVLRMFSMLGGEGLESVFLW